MANKNPNNPVPNNTPTNDTNNQSNQPNNQDQYAPQTPDTNRPDLGAPTQNPTTSKLPSK